MLNQFLLITNGDMTYSAQCHRWTN